MEPTWTLDSKTGLVLLTLSLAVLYHVYFQRNRRLPPGPWPFPLVGNIGDLPPPGEAEYLHWLKHKDMYGPLSSVTVLGQPLVILHDRKAAEVLLEKTSL